MSFTSAASAELFKTEMNQTCPVLGFRRLGKVQVQVMEVCSVGNNGNVEELSQGVAELVQEGTG